MEIKIKDPRELIEIGKAMLESSEEAAKNLKGFRIGDIYGFWVDGERRETLVKSYTHEIGLCLNLDDGSDIILSWDYERDPETGLVI